MIGAASAVAQPRPDAAIVKQLTLEELLEVEVSTLSRRLESWWSAPGAVDVVTGEDIRRSGANSLPDSLRLAAGVHVAQPLARTWGIGIRGFTLPGGNKINVQLDGRPVFTPFYSGVFWDAQDVFMPDIDRIEVVRGPVGALWGSYAVNGFIEVLSKPAWDTQGWLATGTLSTENSHLTGLRYGGKIGENQFYRVYLQYRALEPTFQDGVPFDEPSDFLQTGFRFDARPDRESVATLQGDLYTNKGLARESIREEISGGNVLGRWQRLINLDTELSASAYFDASRRRFGVGLEEQRETLHVSAKYQRSSDRYDLQLGTDNTVSWDRITNIEAIVFQPAQRRISNISVFANGTYHIRPSILNATGGVKVERNSFSGFEIQPTLRGAWTPNAQTTAWAAVSRAVRTPVRLDHDVVFPFVFEANDDYASEVVVAYELGFRQKPSETLAVDLALFLNEYEDLRTYQPLGDAFLPLTFRNMGNARGSGVEVTVFFQPLRNLTLKGSYRYFDLVFSEDPGSRNPTGFRYEANDPRHLSTLSVRYDLPRNLEFDTTFRYVSRLPWGNSPGYVTADLRLGWSPSPEWEFSIIGRNLFDKYHVESLIPQNETLQGSEVKRSFSVRTTWKF